MVISSMKAEILSLQWLKRLLLDIVCKEGGGVDLMKNEEPYCKLFFIA